MSLKVGERAPDFDVTARQAGSDRQLSLQGILGQKNLVLYFYPRDFTAVCTREACGFRNNYAAVAADDTEVVGVSVDDAASHDRFAREYDLPFPLVSDPRLELAKRYGALSTLGGLIGVTGRYTFVIDRSSTIVAVFDSMFRASQHIDGAREAILGIRRRIA
jgi:peroxiredoxin Q/BCP